MNLSAGFGKTRAVMRNIGKKPFEYGCVVKGDFFCPRPDIESTLKRYMELGQNVVVVGERRMGKTSLIELGILYFHEKEYRIFNPFLREWMKRM